MNSRHTVPAVLVLVTLLLMQSSVSHADSAVELRVNAGDTIEIGTDSRGIKPEFSWILTKDRKFQNAQRSRFFQTRFAQAGTYILDVSVQDPAGGANDYRAFTIVVSDQPSANPIPNPQILETTPLQAILRSTSPVVDGKIYVPMEGGLLKIDPSQSTGKISSYDMDVDSTIDSNGDGNPTNDRDTADSLSSKTGSPVYLYVLPKTERRTITLTVSSLTNPVPSTTQLEIAYGAAPASNSSAERTVTRSPGSPILVETKDTTVRLVAQLDPSITTGKELLYEWDFGDRSKSLLTSPTHTYASEGTYTITLTVRDIGSSTVIVTEVASVSIAAGSMSSSSSSTSSVVVVASSSASSSTESPGGSSGSIGAILWVGGILLLLFLLFLALVGIVIFVKSRFTGKIQDTLEKMEKSIVQSDEKQRIIETKVEPMKLKKDDEQSETKKETIIAQEQSRREMQSASVRTNETPVSTSGPVPSWLSKNQSTPPAPSPAPSKPLSTTETKTVANSSAPPPSAPTPPTVPGAPASGPSPSWLKPSAPGGSGTQVPASPPTSTSGPVPAWLEKKPETPVAKPTPQATVTTATAQSTPPTTATTKSPAVSVAPAPVATPAPAPQVKDSMPPAPKTPEQKTAVVPTAQSAVPTVSVAPAPIATPTPAPIARVPSPSPLEPATQPPSVVAQNQTETDLQTRVETTPANASPPVEPISATSAGTPSPSVSTSRTPVATNEQKSEVTNVVADTSKKESAGTEMKPDDDEPVVFIQADSLSKDA